MKSTKIRTCSANALIILALGALTACAGNSDVERSLARQMGERLGDRMLAFGVEEVQCASPQKGKPLSCEVRFEDDLELPKTTVALPGDATAYPSKFKFEYWKKDDGFSGPVDRSRVTTTLDASTLPVKDASDALEATVTEALRLALITTPDYERQRKKLANARSYEIH
jgi:hypothetical protein